MGEVKSSRREKSEATRRKILHAAHEEFCEKGYHGATIASIAKRAGVAGQTVYFVFHTKSALISAVIDNLVMGEEEPTLPQESPWWRAMVGEPDAAAALGHFIRGAGPLFERASTISEILRGAALTDDEVRRTHEFHEDLRRTAFREVVATVAEKAPLRAGLTVDTATDILLTVYGDTTYFIMTKERGWTHDQYIDWLRTALPTLIIELQ